MNQKLKMAEKSRVADLNSKLSAQLSEKEKANKQLKIKISNLEKILSQTKKELDMKDKEINRLKNKLQSIEDPAFFKETDFLQLCSFKVGASKYTKVPLERSAMFQKLRLCVLIRMSLYRGIYLKRKKSTLKITNFLKNLKFT